MNQHAHTQRVGARSSLLRFVAQFVLTAAVALTARADVVFTRSTTTGEAWVRYTATFTPTVSGNYAFSFKQTAGGPSGDNSILIDDVRITDGTTPIFADGFETPAIATNAGITSNGANDISVGNWVASHYAGILDSSPPNWGLAAQGLGTADGTTQYAYIQAVAGGLSSLRTANPVLLAAGRTYTISFYQASRRDFGGTTTYTVNLDFIPPAVYASGISPVIAWDPIFPSGPVNPDSAESKPIPTVGYDDPRWTNPHSATAFPQNSHPWEYESWVPSTFKFDANWINAWGNLNSDGHGKPVYWTTWQYYWWWGWYQTSTQAYQSWTKYSTTVYGSGTYVLQFFADNASWIYINGELVGFQDYNWVSNGSGRYTIQLNGNGPHELSFIIWDGGGAAGGKFRLETAQSYTSNNPGVPLPPPATPTDNTPPVISAPANITREATSAAGTAVTFTATATDDTDGAVPVVAVPASGSTFALGTTIVGLAASDSAGNTASASFNVTVRDTTPPAIGIPANVGPVEATGPAGASVTFTKPGATDIVDGSVAVSASPASGSTFAIGTSTVTLSASDSRGNASSRTFSVKVADTTAPVISAPADITAEATSAAGADVSYSASASDLVDGSVAVSGSPASGSTFAIGSTSVSLSASDSRGNTSSASFNVKVQDTTAPALTVPGNQVLEATSAAGAVASFTPSATDAVGVTSLTTSVASGSTFALGSTTVTATAQDAAGNSSSGSFTIDVVDTTAPAITAPANIVAEATSAAGAAVSYSASAADLVDGSVAVSGSPASGSTFAIGSTSVALSASDSRGNTSSASFSVTVQDTTAPVLTVPANQVLEATSAAGAVANFAASATDAVGVTSLTTSVASGSTFAIGTTTVVVTAQDAAGNTTSGSFTVTVRDTTAPVIATLTNTAPTLWPPNHKMVNVTVNAGVTDAVGVTSVKIVRVTSSEPDNGLGDGDTAGDIVITGNLTLQLRAERSGNGNGRTYTITVEARDAAGNATTRTTTAFVPKSQGK